MDNFQHLYPHDGRQWITFSAYFDPFNRPNQQSYFFKVTCPSLPVSTLLAALYESSFLAILSGSAVLPILFCGFCLSSSACPVLSLPILSVLFWLSRFGNPRLAVMFCLSCSCCTVLTVPFWQSSPCYLSVDIYIYMWQKLNPDYYNSDSPSLDSG